MILKKIFLFYKEGFQNMSKTSRNLWIIILIKLFIMFAILKVFFFKNYLNENFKTQEEKIEHVSEELTKIPK
ncbi:MAG: DUF4492 domain-containing protein [Flavobacteriia bacterium]|nr:MAG: DUF4492 domain-containing protein [Flavobacteriia bacterium]